MIILTMFIFSVLLYSFYQNFIKTKSTQCKIKDNFRDNVAILTKLGYYNYNYNFIKTEILSNCVNYIIFGNNPNLKLIYEFFFDKVSIENEFLPNMYMSYQEHCKKNNKVIGDTTVNEIINFVKKQESFLKIEKSNDYSMRRAIELSKYLYDYTTDRLIDALTYEELDLLTT